MLPDTQYAFDGPEIGSTSVVRVQGDRKQTLGANDNFASFDLALAAEPTTHSPFPTLPVVTHNDIIKVAEELNKFVSNKG
ncbi:hypothetical protein EB001_09220 [bacterium]|nr:hypothetical protein [bacterium]